MQIIKIEYENALSHVNELLNSSMDDIKEYEKLSGYFPRYIFKITDDSHEFCYCLNEILRAFVNLEILKTSDSLYKSLIRNKKLINLRLMIF